MEFMRLVEIAGDELAFGTGLFLAGDVDPNVIRKQLTDDVRPFLEPGADPGLLTLENLGRVLGS